MATLRCYAGNNGFWTEFELVVRTIITEFWKVLTNNVILIGISAIVVLRFGYRYILMVLSGIKKISAKEGTAEFDTGQFQSLLRQMGIGRGETSKSTGSDEKLNSSETVKLNLEDVDLSDSLFFNNSLVLRYLVEVDGQPLS
ncbi:hypothetical protein KKG66_11040, partial [bacterium]|nr:hypothetical protein [bacterium]